MNRKGYFFERFVREIKDEHGLVSWIDVRIPGVMWLSIHVRDSACRAKQKVGREDGAVEHLQDFSVMWFTGESLPGFP